MSTTASTQPLAPVLLLALSLAECLLAVFQWMELLLVRQGGRALCAINETVNCATVWESDFAGRIHHLTLVPVAGLGLVWGLAAFALSAWLTYRQLSGKPERPAVVAVRLSAAVAALSCVTFGVASARMGALCLTCLLTYALVLGFGLVAWRALPGPLAVTSAEARGALLPLVATTGAAYLALLGPGWATPHAGEATPLPKAGPVADAPSSAEALTSLPVENQQEISGSLAAYLQSESRPQATPRFRYGPDDAPVKIIEFTDIRCPHCRALDRALEEIKKAVPAGSISIEPRSFPLDGECNKLVAASDGTGVRCAAASTLACLEGSPAYWRARSKMFDEQETLTKDRVMEIALEAGASKDTLGACLNSAEPQNKLSDDIRFAMEYQPKGTPLVLVNGREAEPNPAFLYALALTRGDPRAPVFAKLAPAPAPTAP